MPVHRLRKMTFAAALLIFLQTTVASGAQEAMSAEAFARHLSELSSRLSTGAPGDVPKAQVPAVWTVDTMEKRFDVPAVWLMQAVGEARRDPSTWPKRRASILSRLETLRLEAESLAERERALASGTADPAAARRALNEVLARPEFRGMAQQSAFETLRQRVFAWFERLLQRLGGGPLGRRTTALALAWITTILALLALAVWTVRLLRRAAPQAARFAPPEADTASARSWARQALRAGDPREATRFAYRAIVACFEEEGLWACDATRTPREYGRMLPADHRRQGPFRDVAGRFEEIWFAARPATDADRDAVLARLKETGCLPAE
jgi:hypothetical protein